MQPFFSLRQAGIPAVAIVLCVLSCLGAEPASTGTGGSDSQRVRWEPLGLSGGGGMFAPAISPANSNLMMLNCDMSAAYISEDGGRNWRMIAHAQLHSDTACRPAFHPTDPNIIYASSGGRLKISRDSCDDLWRQCVARTSHTI